jgi:hypothetical protein
LSANSRSGVVIQFPSKSTTLMEILTITMNQIFVYFATTAMV